MIETHYSTFNIKYLILHCVNHKIIYFSGKSLTLTLMKSFLIQYPCSISLLPQTFMYLLFLNLKISYKISTPCKDPLIIFFIVELLCGMTMPLFIKTLNYFSLKTHQVIFLFVPECDKVLGDPHAHCVRCPELFRLRVTAHAAVNIFTVVPAS
jgi:hypothetical protein